jgi:hypothetical protein
LLKRLSRFLAESMSAAAQEVSMIILAMICNYCKPKVFMSSGVNELYKSKSQLIYMDIVT